MLIKDVIRIIEDAAPLQYQESYDNSGLLVGSASEAVSGVLVSLDITEDVLQEAIQTGCNLIVAHHPLIFKTLKKITGSNAIERCVATAIKNDIAIYASHTSMDAAPGGVNHKIAEKLGLKNISVLSEPNTGLSKLVCYVPVDYAAKVRDAMFESGAGFIGNYDCCSFNTQGTGTYRAGQGSHPFIGQLGELHCESEVKVETIVPEHLLNNTIAAMIAAHPYEEVAYDVYQLKNRNIAFGIGVVGDLPKKTDFMEFILMLREIFDSKCIRSSKSIGSVVNRIALCGGSGAGLIPLAIAGGADVFITGEIGYHQFFTAENKIVLIELGHYETEQFVKEIFYDLISKNNPKFAVRISKINTNPIITY
ncbi:MAG TPA: Nif3-like dinuclear metal center hexameric protein [Bacteroidales bacterium]|nr:Nif3-like dinuclear metal center hexameric protein [Bacteroidales bacterium]